MSDTFIPVAGEPRRRRRCNVVATREQRFWNEQRATREQSGFCFSGRRHVRERGAEGGKAGEGEFQTEGAGGRPA